jgi:hypothetical protein
MAVLGFQDLYESAQVFMQEWAMLSVKDEPLFLASNDGTVWVSFWDNWLLPEAVPPNTQIPVGAIEPLIMINGVVQDPTSYKLDAGDAKRGKVTFNAVPPLGTKSIVTATYRRSMFSQAFWNRNLLMSTDEVAGKLLTQLDVNNLDERTSPWFIIVEMAGLNALRNLQTLLAGLGRGSLGNVTMEFHQAGRMIESSITTLDKQIQFDIVNRRWITSPLPRAAIRPFPGPFGWWVT